MTPPGRAPQAPWMRGAVDGFPPLLQPVAHSLIFVREELQRPDLPSLTVDQLSARPSVPPPSASTYRHLMGGLNRLFTYFAR